MTTPTPGTIPALTPYQPAALPLAGTEAVEIASSLNATSAVSGSMLLTDVVGKTPSVMPSGIPSSSDLVAFYHGATGLGAATQIGNLGVQVGNLPVGGATGQFLTKLSGVNFISNWTDLSAHIATGSAGIGFTGSTTVVFSLSGPLQIPSTLTAFGVLIGQGTSVIAASAAGTTGWVFTGNGTALAPSFQQLTLTASTLTGTLGVPFGGSGTTSFDVGSVLIGSGTTFLAEVQPSTVNLVLLAQGAGIPPVYGQASLTSSVTGTLGVAFGGIGTAALASHGVVLASGAAAFQVVPATTATMPFVSTGTATSPTYTTVSLLLDSTIGSTPGTFLTRTSSTWTAIAGSLVLLNTLTPTAVASTNDTTSLTSIYSSYRITFSNVAPATQTSFLEMQVATSGSAFVSGGYISLATVISSSVQTFDTSTTVILLSGIRATTSLQTTVAYGLSGYIDIDRPSNGTSVKYVTGFVTYNTPGTIGTATGAQANISGFQNATTLAITGINFLFNSGNISTGVIKIYGRL